MLNVAKTFHELLLFHGVPSLLVACVVLRPRIPGGRAHLQRVGGVSARLAALAVALAVSRQQSACQVHGCPPVFCALDGKT